MSFLKFNLSLSGVINVDGDDPGTGWSLDEQELRKNLLEVADQAIREATITGNSSSTIEKHDVHVSVSECKSPLVDCLRDFMTDHYKCFECFPIEFEYGSAVLNFDQMMAHFSDEELDEIKVKARLQSKSAFSLAVTSDIFEVIHTEFDVYFSSLRDGEFVLDLDAISHDEKLLNKLEEYTGIGPKYLVGIADFLIFYIK